MTDRRAASARDLLALVLAAGCWGLGTVISKSAVDQIAPLILLPIQLASSLAVLAVLLRRRGTAVRPTLATPIARLGLLNPGLAYALGLLGLLTIGASLAVLLWSVEPIVILFLAAVVLDERITGPRIVASVVALAGLVLVIASPGGVAGEPVGVALTLAGVVCCAAYTVIARRLLPGVPETSQVVFGQQVYALGLGIPVAAISVALGVSSTAASVTPVAWLSAAVSGILYYAAAYWLYLGALRRVPASTAAASFYLIPVVGIGASAVLLGERLSGVQWLGAGLVVAAVVVMARVTTPGAEPSADPAPARERGLVG